MPYIGNSHIVGDHINNFKVLDDISSYTATFDGSSTDVVSTANETLRIVEHRFVQGQRVTYNNGGGSNIGGLSSGTAYYVSFDTANTIKLATSLVNANTNNVINLTSAGGGTTHTLTAAFDGTNTKFKLTHNSGESGRFNNATQLQVAINNVLQRPNSDPDNFTEGFAVERGNKIVFQTAPTSNDVFWGSIIANSLPTFDIDATAVDNFTGDGITTDFTLSRIPPNSASIIVTINGVFQHLSDTTTARAYSLEASVVKFTSAPANGDEIQVRHTGFRGATSDSVTGFYGRTGNVTLTASDDILTRNINSSGIITATSFSGSGANLTGIDATAVKDTSGNVKIQAQASGAVYTGIHTFTSLKSTSADFSGNVSIAGTLTYEDVKNIDSVGLGTFREGIFIPDSKKIKIGNTASTPDIEIYHSPSNAFIDNHTGGLFIRGNVTSDVGGNVVIQAKVNENSIICHDDGAVDLYFDNSHKVSTNSGGLKVYGSVDANGSIFSTQDNTFFQLGASNDLQLTHNGTDSYIRHAAGSGQLQLRSREIEFKKSDASETMAKFVQDGTVELYYDNAKKLETTTNGIDITGSSTFAQLKLKTSNGSNTGGLYGNSTSLYLLDGQDHQFMQMVQDGEVIIKHDNSNILRTYPSGVEIIGALYATSVDLNDNQKILLGTGDDLEIYHDGSNSYLINKVGDLILQNGSGNSNQIRIRGQNGEESIVANGNGAVDLYYDNSKKFETTSYGAAVTGGINFSGDSLVQDNVSFFFGASNDLQIVHDGTNSVIKNNTGYLNINSGQFAIGNYANSEFYLVALQNQGVELRYDNVKKFETTSVGVSIPQDLDVDGHTNLDNVNIAGVVTATSYYGDGSNLSNVISGVDVKFEGASVGTGVTMLNFVGFNTVTPPASGLSTITSGQNLTIGVRSGSAVEASLTGTSFNVIARSGGNIAINI